MATWKYTGKYGLNAGSTVAVGAGDAEAQSDTISINMDVTNMSRGEALHVIDKIRDGIISKPWPPIA